MELSVNQRAALACKGIVLLACAWGTFGAGHPPGKAQTPAIPVVAVVTHDDEMRDISLSKLQEFRDNQESFNRQLGSRLDLIQKQGEENSKGLATIQNSYYAVIAVVTAFTTLGGYFQFKKAGVK